MINNTILIIKAPDGEELKRVVYMGNKRPFKVINQGSKEQLVSAAEIFGSLIDEGEYLSALIVYGFETHMVGTERYFINKESIPGLLKAFESNRSMLLSELFSYEIECLINSLREDG